MKDAFQRFIDSAIANTKSNPKLCGLAISGSWASGEFDEFSDLDLIVVANDSDYQKVFEDRHNIMKSLGDNVSCFTGEHVGEPRLLICLYRAPFPDSHDRQSCFRSIEAAAEIYRDLRSRYSGVALNANAEAERESLEYISALIKR